MVAISERAPRRLIELLELSYLFCYPMVPIGFACLYLAGLRVESDHVNRLASIQLNTFPSGHAAASVATALAVGLHLPMVGLALGLIALGIVTGSVVGRYHYAADAVAGVALGLAGFAISLFV